MRILRIISRIILGAVFIFSGFVKGVDPLGFQYKMEDYFTAFNMDFLATIALPAAVFLIILELVIGIALLLGLKMKLTAWGAMLLAVYFLILTFFIAVFDLVHDCGCFGDYLIMSNWETFFKNLIFIVFVFIIFFQRKKFKNWLPKWSEWSLILLSVIMSLALSKYCIDHLPVLDFRSWKVGNKIYDSNADEGTVYLIYKNKNTDETKEYLSSNYPWNNPEWVAQWEFVSQRIEKPKDAIENELIIEDQYGDDVSIEYLTDPNPVFLLISYNIAEAKEEKFEQINTFFTKSYQDGYSFIFVVSGFDEEIEQAKQNFNEYAEFFYSDDLVLKTIIRSNPGLILITDGVVIDKWHFNDFPVYEEVKEDYFKNL